MLYIGIVPMPATQGHILWSVLNFFFIGIPLYLDFSDGDKNVCSKFELGLKSNHAPARLEYMTAIPFPIKL